MTQKSDFFDYEKNLSNLLNNTNKIEVYKSPNKKSHRKKSEDQKSFKYDFNNEKLLDNEDNYNALTVSGRVKRGYSHKYRRTNNSNLIISDIEPSAQMSENHPLPNNRYTNSKSGKSIHRLKRRKRVTFKNKFVNVIEVESYKKYNVCDYDKAYAKCSCFIF